MINLKTNWVYFKCFKLRQDIMISRLGKCHDFLRSRFLMLEFPEKIQKIHIITIITIIRTKICQNQKN